MLDSSSAERQPLHAHPVRDAIARSVPLAYAANKAVGGGWAVIGRRSFEALTGPKTDYWLVRTVGGLLTVTGLAIARAQRRSRLTPELRELAIGTGSVLTAIDLIYVARRRISPVYLLDAVANGCFIASWLMRPSETSSNGSGSAAEPRDHALAP
jgi:hypothetical protein